MFALTGGVRRNKPPNVLLKIKVQSQTRSAEMILCSHRQHAHCTQLSPDLIKVSRTCGLTGKLRPCKTRPRAISALCQYPAHLHVQRSVSALLAALQTTSRHRVHQHRSYSLCPASALIMYFCPRREVSPLIFFGGPSGKCGHCLHAGPEQITCWTQIQHLFKLGPKFVTATRCL